MSEFKSFFKRVAGNEGDRCHYPTRLDTYGCGCQHNCGYCYARSLLDFRKMWNPAYPAIANINKIRHTIRTKLRPGEIVRLGGMTDCFQPLERENRITLQTIEALNEMGVGYLIVTKSELVAEPEYLEVMDKDLAHIQVSITSTDDSISRKIEPGASLPGDRIRAVETLQAKGFDVSVRLSPYVPEFVDIGVINKIRCDKVLIEFLRVNSWIRKWLTNLDAGIDLSRYSEHHAGYDHLPIGDKRLLLDRVIGFREVSVCEDVEDHQRWWVRNVNANPDDCCNLRKPKTKQDMEPTDKCKKERKDIPIDLLLLNKGQVSWLPKNPRRWTAAGVQRMVDSLNEDPDFLEDRPPLVVPYGDKFVVFASNLRVEGEKRRKARMSLPCIVYYPETDEDRETVKRRATKDNGHMGLWDVDELANEVWGDAKTLQAYGVDGVIDPEEQVKKVLKDQEVIARTPFTEVLGEEHNYIVLKFDNTVDWLQALTMFEVEPAKALPTKTDGEQSLAFQKRIGVGRVLDGPKAIENLKAYKEVGNGN